MMAPGKIEQISPETLKDWMDKDQVILIDVRQPEEYAAGYIEGSHLSPLPDLPNNWQELGLDQNKKIVLQCKSGGRSMNACLLLAAECPELDFYNLEGGIMNWAKAGFDIKV
jgi:rhodanese-related sulfurtransferase